MGHHVEIPLDDHRASRRCVLISFEGLQHFAADGFDFIGQAFAGRALRVGLQRGDDGSAFFGICVNHLKVAADFRPKQDTEHLIQAICNDLIGKWQQHGFVQIRDGGA